MRIVKRALLGIVVVLLVLVAVAYALPSRYHVERSIEIAAPPAKVYPLVANVRTWKEWSAWNRRDPDMTIVYSGPESGPGAKWSWKSRSEGDGEMTFTAAEPDRSLAYALFFPEFDARAAGTNAFAPSGASATRVTWSNDGELGNNPMMRWMGLAMDRMVGDDFDAGLRNLKALAER